MKGLGRVDDSIKHYKNGIVSENYTHFEVES